MTQSTRRMLGRWMDQSGGVSSHGGVVFDRRTRRVMERREKIEAEKARKKEEA